MSQVLEKKGSVSDRVRKMMEKQVRFFWSETAEHVYIYHGAGSQAAPAAAKRISGSTRHFAKFVAPNLCLTAHLLLDTPTLGAEELLEMLKDVDKHYFQKGLADGGVCRVFNRECSQPCARGSKGRLVSPRARAEMSLRSMLHVFASRFHPVGDERVLVCLRSKLVCVENGHVQHCGLCSWPRGRGNCRGLGKLGQESLPVQPHAALV